jgi:parvulin-like peptidyl-prolyl isomerase
MNVRKALGLAAALVLVGSMVAAVVHAEIIEQVLVKVNGEVLSKSDLEARQVAALRQSGRLNQRERTSDAELRQMLNEVTPRILVNAVDEMLLVQRGKELGFKLTDEQFKTAIDNIKKDNKIESEEAFTGALSQEGMTLADLRTALERQRMTFLVRQREVMERLSVTEEETRRYYDTHKGEFSTPPAVTLRELLVAVPASGAGEDEARKKADDIRRRAAAGEAFDKLASELSDSPSRANAGLIGPISLEDLAKEIRDVVEPLKPGDLSEVFRTAAGLQILKIETMTDREITPYDKARDRIGEKVFTTKQQEEFQKYLEKLRGQAIIQWKSPDLQKAYEEGLKLGITLDAGA